MKRLSGFVVLSALASAGFAQNLYSNQSSDVNVAQLEAVTTTRSGVAAAAGARWSEVQANGPGVQPESNTVAGFSWGGAFRLADDFTVGAGGWNVTGFKVYGYVTGGGANPFTSGSLNLWNGNPGLATSSILGSATLGGQTSTINWAGGGSGLIHRIFNTNSPVGTAPGTTRVIHELSYNLGITLSAGTYWIDYAASGGFAPSTTHLNSRGPAGANAMQFNATWGPLIDAGNPGTAPDVAQEMPFIVTGTAVPEPATMAVLGLGAAALLRRRRKA